MDVEALGLEQCCEWLIKVIANQTMLRPFDLLVGEIVPAENEIEKRPMLTLPFLVYCIRVFGLAIFSILLSLDSQSPVYWNLALYRID